MTGGPLNLSLLSRGVGEVQKNGHEKVEVFLEPEDYHNFSKNVDSFYLPPIHSTYPSFLASTPGYTARSSREAQEFRVPKTFTTRKGALLLFSEDLAQRNMERERAAKRKAVHHSQPSTMTPSTSLDSQVDLRTVEDLAHSILKYGSHDRADDKVYLKFLHARRDNFERQIRPGFSAKRYLSTWTRTWDDSVFDNVIKHGYITERSLYHYNLVLPHLRRRLFHEDLSHMPQPYRLMRNMLMAPGSLSGYTFYRAPTIDFAECIEEEDDDVQWARKRSRIQNIRVVKTQGGLQEEIMYSDLDKQSQKEVITDLLVKSAVHYALQKQEEIYQDTIIRAIHSEQKQIQPGFDDQQAIAAKAHEFDMNQAVESLLDSQHGRLAIGADLPEIDDRSQASEMAGSFKGSTSLPHHVAKQNASQRSGWPNDSGPVEKEYLGGVPVVSVKDAVSDVSSHQSSVPQLPPIRHTLSPIHDVSRETTQPYITLPPIGRDSPMSTYTATTYDLDALSTDPPTVTVVPATPQRSTVVGSSSHDPIASDQATRGLLSRNAYGTQDLLEEEETEVQQPDTDREKDDKEKKKQYSPSSVPSSERGKGKGSSHAGDVGEAAAHHVGGSSTSGTARSRPQWKTGTRKGSKPGSVVESIKGSMVMAPDGEIISVGGSVARDVGNLNDVPTGHRLEGAGGPGTDESGASDDEPDEWKNAKKFSLSTKSDSLKKVFKRGSVSSSSVAKSDIERLGSAGKQILWDHASQSASEIDYTSGDIDATMSIHSWSYAVPEHDHEFGLHHATSVHSLPGLQLDGGGGLITSTADGQNDTHPSTESSDGEHWAKITERPEEEEIANIESREVTLEEIEIPRVPSPSPVSEVKTAEDSAVKETILEEDEDGAGEEQVSADKAASTPRSKSIGLQTDSDAGSHIMGKHDTPKGMASKTPKTPGRSTGFDADDEGEDDDNNGDESGWLEAVKEASVEHSSRKESLVSKIDASRSESKTASGSRAESKLESMAGKTQDAAKSAAPSVASERKSVATIEGKVTESGAATPTAEAVPEEIVDEKLASEGEGKTSARDSKTGSLEEKSRSVSQKSKPKSGALSVDKSQRSSNAGRGSADTSSPTKGVKSVSSKGDKSASGKTEVASAHSSKKSKRADSQNKTASRATTGTKLSHAKLTTPPATAEAEAAEAAENFEDNPWADEDDDDIDDDEREREERDLNEFGKLEDTEEYRMPSTPSEDNAKISGEDTRRPSNLDLTIAGQQLLSPPSTPSKSKKKKDSFDRETMSRHSSVTEKDIMDTLTDHAQRIAESVLSQPMAGQDLEADVKKAATMWAEMHPPRPLSRAHSVREFRADAIEEIMKNRRASSAVPSAADYKALIKKSLTTAVAKAAGLDPDTISDDAEISPELLEALASQKLTPDQIEIVSDAEGRTRIQSRVDPADIQAVQEGHLFIAPGKEETGGIKRQVSIPADRVSNVDDMEVDRISYQGTDVGSDKGEKKTSRSKAGSKPGSKAGSIAGGTMADLSEMEGMMAELEGKVERSGKPDQSPEHEDDFLAAVKKMEGKSDPSPPLTKRTTSGKTTPSAVEEVPTTEEEEKKGSPQLPGGTEEKKAEDLQSVKSGKTGVSQKSAVSKDSKKKEKEEPFVVGKVDEKGENERLYGPVDPPPPKPEPEKVVPKQPTPPPPAPVEEGKVEPPAPVVEKEEEKKEPSPLPIATGAADATPSVEETTVPAPAVEPVAAAEGPKDGPKDGLLDHKDELTKLYGSKGPPIPPPKLDTTTKGKPREKKPKKEPVGPKKEEKKKKGKKTKKQKKKDEEAALIEEMRNQIEGKVEEPAPDPVPPAPVVEKEPTPREASPMTSEPKASSPEFRTDESDGEFQFVREASSPEMDTVPQTRIHIPSPPIEEEDKSDEEAADNGDDGLKAISNREARAAKRAAAAAKRREEVERRRREKEELAKKEKEEVERQMALQREMEEERRRREEERRLRKEHQKEAELKEQKERDEAERRAKVEAERERKAKEDYQKKLEEIKRRQHEEEIRRHELMLQKQREEEERRLAEEELMSQMAEQERLEYEQKKREEEEERKRKEEEDRLRRIEEAKRAMEEAQRLAEEMARKQAELEARLKFNRDLQVESSCLNHSQGINRAFVFSYFELLQWLGLDIPEFELAKLADY